MTVAPFAPRATVQAWTTHSASRNSEAVGGCATKMRFLWEQSQTHRQAGGNNPCIPEAESQGVRGQGQGVQAAVQEPEE